MNKYIDNLKRLYNDYHFHRWDSGDVEYISEEYYNNHLFWFNAYFNDFDEDLAYIKKLRFKSIYTDYIIDESNNDVAYYEELKGVKKKMENLIKTEISDIKKLAFKNVKKTLINHFTVSLPNFIYRDHQKYDDVIKYIKSLDKNSKHHFVSYLDGKDMIMDTSFIIKLRSDTYMYISAGNENLEKSFNGYFSNMFNYSTLLSIKIFGKKAYAYAKKLMQLSKIDNSKPLTASITFNKRDESCDYFVVDMERRSIDTLFFSDHIKETIVKSIDSFIENSELYNKRNLRHKIGILLYGEPGTGKSSLANAIATKYNLDLLILNMDQLVKINVEKLCSQTNTGNLKVILLEDIDTLIKNRDNEITTDQENIINKLLQFLDSNISPSNTIFIATTNHIEKLDKAITRKGRFDLALEVKPLDECQVFKMCKSFDLTNEESNEIVSSMKTNRINQSLLQDLILNKIKSR